MRRCIRTYNGPIVNLQRAADGATADFADQDCTGKLVTNDANATPVRTWLGAATIAGVLT